MSKRQVQFLIDNKTLNYPINQDGSLETTNHSLVPEQIQTICKNYLKWGPHGTMFSGICYPYLNYEAFKLFMNLILTPRHIKINNPHNLTVDDLEPIFATFVINNVEKDDSEYCLLNRLKLRLLSDNE